MTVPNEIVARRLLKQAELCERLGSHLYSNLLLQFLMWFFTSAAEIMTSRSSAKQNRRCSKRFLHHRERNIGRLLPQRKCCRLRRV